MADLVFTADAEHECPFCGGTYALGHTEDGQNAVTHTYPICDPFGRLDALDFAQAARAKITGKIVIEERGDG